MAVRRRTSNGSNGAVLGGSGASSGVPVNAQNIPTRDEGYKEVRRLFVPMHDSEVWVKLDYSQLELRVLAEASRDPVLVQAFQAGEDLHLATALDVFGDAGMRRFAKNLNFALSYGAGATKVVEMFRRDGMELKLEEASQIVQRLSARYARVEEYRQEVHRRILETGEARTLYGRRRLFEGLRYMNRQDRARVLREGFNHVVQGTAWDVFALAQLALRPLLDEEHRVVNMVHDEDSMNMRLDLPWLRKAIAAMEGVTGWQPGTWWPVREWAVPLVVEATVGPNWVDQEEVVWVGT